MTHLSLYRYVLYLRQESDEIFTPVHLCPVNMDTLIKLVKNKFQDLKHAQVDGIVR